MTTWTSEDLALLAGAESLVMTAGDDGHPGVEIGMVLVGGELYVRAHRGVRSRWYQAAQKHGHGQIRVGAVTRDVLLETCDSGPAFEIDAAYRNKYGQAAGALAASSAAYAATIRIDPAPSSNGATGLIR
ncbi:DUF2255 family protein [Streptomyces brasiliensis]|uniref:DUF2255 family protein n=1 Tax=Streptomyces brasiliensis TaxID=1954 RepID=A0A917KRH3_9ACTN|nr:DUF2255 family protein [Streptomyces brasiliensis]GGJ23054.1 hypothetical protein GCM10010121_037500 [Streptomyces brasiliensis]